MATNQLLAICGLDCAACESRIATQANDQAALERIAAKWREEFHAPDITAASVMCDGCTAPGTRRSGYCSMCEIRACGTGRGVANCAYCGEYASCEKLAAFLQMGGPSSPAKANLETIRATL